MRDRPTDGDTSPIEGNHAALDVESVRRKKPSDRKLPNGAMQEHRGAKDIADPDAIEAALKRRDSDRIPPDVIEAAKRKLLTGQGSQPEWPGMGPYQAIHDVITGKIDWTEQIRGIERLIHPTEVESAPTERGATPPSDSPAHTGVDDLNRRYGPGNPMMDPLSPIDTEPNSRL